MTYLNYNPPSTLSIDGDVKKNSGVGHDDKKNTQFVLAADHRMNPTKCRSSSGSRMRAKTGYIEAASRPFFSIGTYEAVEPLNDVRVIQSEAVRMNKLPQRSNAEIRGSAFD